MLFCKDNTKNKIWILFSD